MRDTENNVSGEGTGKANEDSGGRSFPLPAAVAVILFVLLGPGGCYLLWDWKRKGASETVYTITGDRDTQI